MLLQVNAIPTDFTATRFAFTVPGPQTWRLRAIRATVNRDTGGVPDRAYLLSVTNETNVVAQTGAADAGGEPGTTSITWCDIPASALTAGTVGVVVAPLPTLRLESGYVLAGTILNPVGADAWVSAVAWYDFTYTVPSG